MTAVLLSYKNLKSKVIKELKFRHFLATQKIVNENDR